MRLPDVVVEPMLGWQAYLGAVRSPALGVRRGVGRISVGEFSSRRGAEHKKLVRYIALTTNTPSHLVNKITTVRTDFNSNSTHEIPGYSNGAAGCRREPGLSNGTRELLRSLTSSHPVAVRSWRTLR